MDEASLQKHLSKISTLWTLVQKAHMAPVDEAAAAQHALLERYSRAIYRYLLGALRQPEAADELFQEFSLRLLRGDFRRANPERGRFRDFVKTSLFHLIIDHKKGEQRRPRSLSPGLDPPAEPAPTMTETEQAFMESWRTELLETAWLGLERAEHEAGRPYYRVLRLRAENPDLSSPEMAERISQQLGKSVTPEAARQMLHRAREQFADLLLNEVAHSLSNPSPEQLEQELTDLGLIAYCRSALKRLYGK
jgi:RNA polymerase sigma factor (sigma-70 family)